MPLNRPDSLHILTPKPETARNEFKHESEITDSLAVADSLSVVQEPVWGLTLQPPVQQFTPPPQKPEWGVSWLAVILLIPFFIVGIKMKSSPRFLASLFQDLTSIRERHSIFDTTVRESSLLFCLITLTTLSAGVLLGAATMPSMPPPGNALVAPFSYFDSPQLLDMLHGVPFRLLHTLGCMSITTIYMVGMWIAYYISGHVFERSIGAKLWMKGFAASMGLLGLILLPLALITLAIPAWTTLLVMIAIIAFIFAKITFIWKGFRIFCSKGASWVLFLYYLCSLEIVPVIITVLAAFGQAI